MSKDGADGHNAEKESFSFGFSFEITWNKIQSNQLFTIVRLVKRSIEIH
jgi:hypothetical protein